MQDNLLFLVIKRLKNMRRNIILIILITVFFICCNNHVKKNDFTRISADSLVSQIDKYNNVKVELEGVIVHICGVNGKKMKLETESGSIIKIVPKDSLLCFDTSFFNKRVRVKGIAKENRIDESYIKKIENEKLLLCHIDHTPCKDSLWVNYQIKKGLADTISKQDIEILRRRMEQTGKKYLSLITIFAEEVEIINK